MNRWPRLWRHLTTGSWTRRRLLPESAMAEIEAAVRETEARHAGEIRVAVEASLDVDAVLQGVSPRERAIQVFSELGVWDTEDNNGVLIYLLLADHDVEIVADRGAARGAGQKVWDDCCRLMEAEFRQGRFGPGVVAGIRAIAEVLAQHPGTRPDAGNELPDSPAIL